MATRAETETKPDALRREYAAWSKAQGLSLGIADEHIFDETLTEARRTWVRDFSRRWEEAARRWGRKRAESCFAGLWPPSFPKFIIIRRVRAST